MTPMDLHASEKHQDLSTAKLKEGDPAYNFQSQIYDFSDGTGVVTGRFFDLLERAREKPVALIFGSYT